MIPRDFITEWRRVAPWVQDHLVEQDLVITRAVTELFSDPFLRQVLAFRGGTALHKLHLQPAVRFSEDIDLVLMEPRRIGPVFDAIQTRLNPILGLPRRSVGAQTATLRFSFASEDLPPVPLRLKVEINTQEHRCLYGFVRKAFHMDSRWFSGGSDITTFELEELLGTKLRALYQRRKGRDLFDLARALRLVQPDGARIVNAFQAYMADEGKKPSRTAFAGNLMIKLQDPLFTADLSPLLRIGVSWNPSEDGALVMDRLISRLP